MSSDLAHQLKFLGVIPQPGHVEYGFRVEGKDKNVRLVVLEIENCFFERRDLMVQEAPDLCYQKMLADLGKETADAPIASHVPVTASDIAGYREMHPTAKQRKPSRKDQK